MPTAILPAAPPPAAGSPALLSAEEYLRLDGSALMELIEGRIAEMPPPTPFHGRCCGRFVMLLGMFIMPRKLGDLVCNDAGVLTQRDPDTVRGADVAFYSAAKLPGGQLPKHGLPETPPDLVVEVRSEHDRRSELFRKVGEYLNAGVQVVAVFDPFQAVLEIHRESGTEVFRGAEVWTLPDLLPGFSATVDALLE